MTNKQKLEKEYLLLLELQNDKLDRKNYYDKNLYRYNVEKSLFISHKNNNIDFIKTQIIEVDNDLRIITDRLKTLSELINEQDIPEIKL